MEYLKQILEVFCKRPQRLLISFFWLLQGKKLRARNKLGLLETHVRYRYRDWQRIYEKDESINVVQGKVKSKYIFLVCLDGLQPRANSEQSLSLASLEQQGYNNWSLYDASAAVHNDFLNRFDYLLWLRQGDILPPNALLELAKAIEDNHRVGIVYSDHDYLSAKGHREYPYFKGDWNYLLLQHSDYVCGLCAIRADLLSSLGGEFDVFSWAGRYQALVKLGTEEGLTVLHVSKILYHCRRNENSYPGTELLMREGGQNALSLASSNMKIAHNDHFKFMHPVTIPTPLPEPKVTIIIPTRDRLALLEPCVNSILKKTTHDNFEILIIDNNSEQVETLKFFDTVSKNSHVNILDFPEEFNYAAANDLGVENSDSELVCLLNNDTAVIEPEWLNYLVVSAVKSDTGVVGAKLLYADRRIQHAGIIVGLGGLAGHGHRYLKDDKPGYFYQAHLPQQVSAVTGACLMVAREKYLEVGGMDSESFPVAFNDVDFCLKLDKAGYKNVYEPRAVLYHYESQSRGKDLKGEKRERYIRECEALRKRWSTDNVVDRFYSPHLASDREDFAIRTSTN